MNYAMMSCSSRYLKGTVYGFFAAGLTVKAIHCYARFFIDKMGADTALLKPKCSGHTLTISKQVYSQTFLFNFKQLK
jgi:hypothetical protein